MKQKKEKIGKIEKIKKKRKGGREMGGGLLKFVLRVIPSLIFVLCVLAAFATHEFSLKSTLFSASPEEILAAMLPSLNTSMNGEFIEIVDSGTEGDKRFITLSARSPFPANLTVKSGSLYAEGVKFELVEPVEIPAGGSAILRFEAPLASSAQQTFEPEVSEIALKMDVKGVEIEFNSFATQLSTAATAAEGMSRKG